MCGGAAVSGFPRAIRATLSTSEAEYVGMGDAVKEALLFLRQIYCFLFPDRVVPCMRVFEDGIGAVQLASNPGSSSNPKNALIDVRQPLLKGACYQAGG